MRPNRQAQSSLQILSDSKLKLFEFWEIQILKIIRLHGSSLKIMLIH
jgi:hypothetical protein